MKTMAGIVTGTFEARLDTVELKEPGPDDVLIRTEYSFVSNGTESNVHRGAYPETPYDFPIMIGYQAVGRVEHVGNDVRDIHIGDRVFTRRNQVLNITRALGGTHAQTLCSPADEILHVPTAVDSVEASALVIAQVGYNGAQRLPEINNTKLLVLGDGLIGQFTAQAALARGFSVLLLGHHTLRLALAKKAAPSLITVNSRERGWEKALDGFFGNQWPMAIDSVGSRATIEFCMKRLARFGHFAILGWQGGDQTVPVHAALTKELTVHFPSGVRRERMEATLQLIKSGKLKVKPLITHSFKCAQFPEACQLIASADKDYLGIVIDWTDEKK